MKRGITYILMIFIFGSCFKDKSYDTNLVVRPWVQYISGEDFYEYSDCVAYAFDADTADWEVLSWADARDGVLTSKVDSSQKLYPFAVGQAFSIDTLEDTMLNMRVAMNEVFLVVAHTTTEDYAYRPYSVGLNISTTFLYARFRPWKEGEYTESNWIYYSPEVVEDDTDE